MNTQSRISFFFSSTNYSSVLELNVCTVGPRVQHFFSLISSFIVRLYLSSGHVWFPENPSRQKLFLTDSSSNRSGSNLKDMNEIGQINIVNPNEKKTHNVMMWYYHDMLSVFQELFCDQHLPGLLYFYCRVTSNKVYSHAGGQPCAKC